MLGPLLQRSRVAEDVAHARRAVVFSQWVGRVYGCLLAWMVPFLRRTWVAEEARDLEGVNFLTLQIRRVSGESFLRVRLRVK